MLILPFVTDKVQNREPPTLEGLGPQMKYILKKKKRKEIHTIEAKVWVRQPNHPPIPAADMTAQGKDIII